MSAAPQGRGLPVRELLPMGAIAFLLFATIAIPIPALAIHLHDRLGLGPIAVGWVIGAQSISTVLCRNSAGRIVDRIGPKAAVLIGLPIGVLSGLFYAASVLASAPQMALAIILLGRAVLGVAESLILTSTVTWSIGRLGPQATSPAISVQGLAIYAALGLGAPIGLLTQEHAGFAAVGFVTAVPCLVAIAIAVLTKAVAARGRERAEVTPLSTVLRWVAAPGALVLGGTVGYAGLVSFLALFYRAQGWDGAGFGFAGFAAGFIIIRLVGMHWAEQRGGWQVACASLAVEALGLALLCLASSPILAVVGTALTGAGFSLIFPAMGVEAVRNVPAARRGQAYAVFAAFNDIAVGGTGPLLGLLIREVGYGAAFGAGAVAAACGMMFGVARLRRA